MLSVGAQQALTVGGSQNVTVGASRTVTTGTPVTERIGTARSSQAGTTDQLINATNATYQESAMSFMTPPNPAQLDTLKRRRAKMIVVHGVSDPIFSADDSVAWYRQQTERNEGDASHFARLFRVPGMGHCSGGPAPTRWT